MKKEFLDRKTDPEFCFSVVSGIRLKIRIKTCLKCKILVLFNHNVFN
jgi:hypothetical protein